MTAALVLAAVTAPLWAPWLYACLLDVCRRHVDAVWCWDTAPILGATT